MDPVRSQLQPPVMQNTEHTCQCNSHHCWNFLNLNFLSSIIVHLQLFVDTNWGRFKSALDVPEFHETIEAFEDYNQSVINKEGLALASQGCIVSIYVI